MLFDPWMLTVTARHADFLRAAERARERRWQAAGVETGNRLIQAGLWLSRPTAGHGLAPTG